MPTILVISDEKEQKLEIAIKLRQLGHHVVEADNGHDALDIIDSVFPDAVITDLNMPGMSGLELLRWIQEEGPSIPVIMMSGYGDIHDAIAAMKLGAQDYIVKPFDLDEFVIRLKRLVENQNLQDQIEIGKRKLSESQNWIGESPEMKKVNRLIEQIAPTSSTVLITGESGTGKEVVARAIHRLSPRAAKPFVAVNMGGVPENLLESELFGYEKGAFTGAGTKKIGMFELASSGTLFLDEVGDMPLHLK